MEWNLKHREKLLAELASQLKQFEDHKVYSIKVTLLLAPNGHRRRPKTLVEIYGLEVALDWLINDIYFDESSNWAEADMLRLGTY